MKITVSTSAGDTVLTDAPPRQYYRLRWDWEAGSEKFNHPRRNMPGVLNFQQMQHNNFKEDWQRFWFGLNQTGDRDRDVRAWNVYTNGQAFLTDGTGTDFYRNYIDGTNMDKAFPKIETKGCCGNVVCIVGDPRLMWYGMQWAQIETMDITQAPPAGVSYRTHPHLIHHAVNLASGASGYVCNPFTHLGGRNTGIPVLFPVTSRGPVYYPFRYLQKLPLGSRIPNPYSPPMQFV